MAAGDVELTLRARYAHPQGVSNAIRYDALLLAALAGELERRLRGARVSVAWLDRTRRVLALELGEKRAPRTLSWNLHPTAGQVALREGVAPERGALLQVRPGTRIAAVQGIADERVLRIELETDPDAAAGVVRALVVELIGNRWNAIALGAADTITAALVPRAEGPSVLRPGARYEAPPRSTRSGVHELPTADEWRAQLEGVLPRDRTRALLARFAWTSPLNAGWILGDAAVHEVGVHVLDEGLARYAALRTEPSRPHLLHGRQPYIHPLDDPHTPMPTLLDAFERAATAGDLPALGEDALREVVRARLHERASRIRARLERVRGEAAEAAAEAASLRGRADLLLAHLYRVPRGAADVELENFEGGRTRVALDPALTPQQNAERLYEQAKRRARAAERTPALLARARQELERVESLRRSVEAGEVGGAELAELARRAERPARAAALPYRRYRTSGGLEVRVGRSSKANDALTTQHAAPEDIWLHARDVGGAHVILRWGRKDANPPRSDLVEAAVLAALHSRARTSGTVPVDWTRRKYVRKPRKAPPGLVIPERVGTLFVQPDAKVEERLRVDEDEA
jgi:predicted ribosome quality control (RQC) complex YloA/Tae2 family protein